MALSGVGFCDSCYLVCGCGCLLGLGVWKLLFASAVVVFRFWVWCCSLVFGQFRHLVLFVWLAAVLGLVALVWSISVGGFGAGFAWYLGSSRCSGG